MQQTWNRKYHMSFLTEPGSGSIPSQPGFLVNWFIPCCFISMFPSLTSMLTHFQQSCVVAMRQAIGYRAQHQSPQRAATLRRRTVRHAHHCREEEERRKVEEERRQMELTQQQLLAEKEVIGSGQCQSSVWPIHSSECTVITPWKDGRCQSCLLCVFVVCCGSHFMRPLCIIWETCCFLDVCMWAWWWTWAWAWAQMHMIWLPYRSWLSPTIQQ